MKVIYRHKAASSVVSGRSSSPNFHRKNSFKDGNNPGVRPAFSAKGALR